MPTINTIECPKCGKNTVVERGESIYQCLSCEFKRDLSKPEAKSGSDFPWIVMLGLMITLLVLNLYSTPPLPQQNQPLLPPPGGLQSVKPQ